jgi:hypothetical protein
MAKTTGKPLPMIVNATVALWPTPTSLAPARHGNNEACNSAGLVAIRAHALAMYPTPRASANENRTTKIPPSQLDGRHGLYLSSVAIGMEPAGSSATTEKPGALAPEFVAWLMSFPPEWLACAPEKNPQPKFRGKKSK